MGHHILGSNVYCWFGHKVWISMVIIVGGYEGRYHSNFGVGFCQSSSVCDMELAIEIYWGSENSRD